MQPNEITEVRNRPISQELLARDVTRLAYVAKDGTRATYRLPSPGTGRTSSCVRRRTRPNGVVTLLGLWASDGVSGRGGAGSGPVLRLWCAGRRRR
jgi:hypothetical protein